MKLKLLKPPYEYTQQKQARRPSAGRVVSSLFDGYSLVLDALRPVSTVMTLAESYAQTPRTSFHGGGGASAPPLLLILSQLLVVIGCDLDLDL